MALYPNFTSQDALILDKAEYFTVFQKRGNRRQHCYKKEFTTLQLAMEDAEATYKEYSHYGAMVYAVAGNRDCMVGVYSHRGGEIFI
jgi:hypothetical protein